MKTVQRTEALQQANRVRFARAAVKKQVAKMGAGPGRREIARIIRDMPPLWHTIRLDQLLTLPALTGTRTCLRWCAAIEATPLRQLGQLTDRQRIMLAGLLDPESKPYRESVP